MSKRLTLAIDIDNTVADTTTAVVEMTNKKYGSNLTVDDVTEWDAKMKFGDKTIDYTKELFKNFANPEFMASIKPIDGAVEGVKTLQSMGHKLFFLTSRNTKYAKDTDKWVEYNFPGMHVDYAPDGKDKFTNTFDVLFDDSPKEVERVTLAGKSVVIFDKPWNRDVPQVVARRVTNWNEFINLIKTRDF